MAIFDMPAGQLRRIIKGTVLEHSGTTVLKRNAAAAICSKNPTQAAQLLAKTDSPAIRDSIKVWLKR
jgi:hypothetical protein